jgi:hypothetical protein
VPPTGTSVHVLLPGSQYVDTHWLLVEHASPLGTSAHVLLPLSQYPDWHWAPAEQAEPRGRRAAAVVVVVVVALVEKEGTIDSVEVVGAEDRIVEDVNVLVVDCADEVAERGAVVVNTEDDALLVDDDVAWRVDRTALDSGAPVVVVLVLELTTELGVGRAVVEVNTTEEMDDAVAIGATKAGLGTRACWTRFRQAVPATAPTNIGVQPARGVPKVAKTEPPQS